MTSISPRTDHTAQLRAGIEKRVPLAAARREVAVEGLWFAVVLQHAAAGTISKGPDQHRKRLSRHQRDVAESMMRFRMILLGPTSSHEVMAMLSRCGPGEIDVATATAARPIAGPVDVCSAVAAHWHRCRTQGPGTP